MGGRALLVVAGTCALTAVGFALGLADERASGARAVWVGQIQVTYTSNLQQNPSPSSGFSRSKSGRATIRSFPDGTVSVFVEYTDRAVKTGTTCNGIPDTVTVTIEGWRAAVGRRPSVSFDPKRRRYLVSYSFPAVNARYTRRREFAGRRGCNPDYSTRSSETRAGLPYLAGEGRAASANIRSVAGTRQRAIDCGPSCSSSIRVSWNLTRRTGDGGSGGGGGGGGGGGSGGGSAGPTAPCRNRIEGTPGPDVLVGTPAPDAISGATGDDQLTGGAGGDCLYGDDGADIVRGENDPDLVVGGPGADKLEGGAANDIMVARDGEVDDVRCGAGTDVVWADRADRLSSCERVQR